MFGVSERWHCARSGLTLDASAQLLGLVPQLGPAVGLQRGQGALQLLAAPGRHAVPLLALCSWDAGVNIPSEHKKQTHRQSHV